MEANTFCKILTTGGDTRYVSYPINQNAPVDDGEIIVSISENEYNAAVVALTTKVKTYKELRVEAVSRIIVTTSTGNVFDGDELSQDRMLRALQISSITGQATTYWKLADNSTVEVTLSDLKEALTLAGVEMARIWLTAEK